MEWDRIAETIIAELDFDDTIGRRKSDIVADEVVRLRAALALAVGELSTHGEHRHTNPVALMQQFLEEARRER
jgi:hypothetical protein